MLTGNPQASAIRCTAPGGVDVRLAVNSWGKNPVVREPAASAHMRNATRSTSRRQGSHPWYPSLLSYLGRYSLLDRIQKERLGQFHLHPLKGTCQENNFPPTRTAPVLAGTSPCAEPPVPTPPSFCFFSFLVSGLFRTTHPSVSPTFVGFQKISVFPASLTGLTGPMVVSHSCLSS